MLRLLINMDKSRDRFDKVSSRLAYLGINFKRISAIDGNELTDDFLGKITLPKNDKRKIGCPRDLLRGGDRVLFESFKMLGRIVKV